VVSSSRSGRAASPSRRPGFRTAASSRPT
jgi:hypothetical protein